LATLPAIILKRSPFSAEDAQMVRHLCLAALLMTLAGAASAQNEGESGNGGGGGEGEGGRSEHHLRAPEIDPASAMAGLTMLAGGLAVLRGRRREQSQK
jgi:hypothetical protein